MISSVAPPLLSASTIALTKSGECHRRFPTYPHGLSAGGSNLERILPLHSPFATTVWDFIHRAMPLGNEGTLSADEVYALTAYLLFLNQVIPEDEVLDKQSLPKVKMPHCDDYTSSRCAATVRRKSATSSNSFTTNSFSSAGERPSMFSGSGMPAKNLTRAALRIL
jgi:hypothetical protein